jgi:hypothetical protein
VDGICTNGGTLGAIGSTCTPNACPQVACCTGLGACAMSVDGACTNGGTLGAPGSTCTPNLCPQVACCSSAGNCMTSTNGVCPAGTTPGAPGSSCTQPNVCQTSPRPCCNGITGQCTLVSPASPCPTGTLPGPAGSTVCSPNPCPFPNAATAQTCLDCTYVNGAFDGVNGQLSHLGGGYPRGGKAADDFYLTEDFMHDVKTFSATLLTNTSLGLVKPKGEIWSDCNGCPGTLLYTFDNPLIVETGLDIGPAYDGRLLRIVHVTFDVTRETILANKNVVLRGGRYWLSVYGQTVGNDPADVTYWGTTDGPVKGKAAYKIDGNLGNPYGVYTFPSGCGPAAWHSVTDDCCVGCKDLNFSFCTTPCKILVDNGAARTQVGNTPNGSTSQFAGGTLFETRSADDFNVPPCQDYHICYVEACILTNCTTFDGIFELYANNCNKPAYALYGQPLFNTQYVATKVIPLGAAYTSVIDGTTVYGYKLEFHDLNITLTGGQQYWISAGVRYTFNTTQRAYFCYNQYCNNTCNIRWNSGRVLTFQTLDAEAAAHGCVSASGPAGCNGWAKVNNDFSFLIAADGLTTPGPINGAPGCTVDADHDGRVTVQDIFEFLNTWFAGCP